MSGAAGRVQAGVWCQGRISQPSLAVNLLFVAAPDGQSRIAEAFRLVLRAAARGESGDTVPVEQGEKQVEE